MQRSTLLVALTLFALATQPPSHADDECPAPAPEVRPTPDPRTFIEIGDLRICGVPGTDQGLPETSEVVVWEAGEAPWARTAAIPQSGVVIIQQKTAEHWKEVLRLGSPKPAAYSGFGTQLAANTEWLAVLAARQQRVWIFDLKDLGAAARELEDVRGFAKTIAILGSQIVVGGLGAARFYQITSLRKPTDIVAAPKNTEGIFTGQIVAQDNLLVSTAAGLSNGDGVSFPGRVDVFRRSAVGWQWEAKLSTDNSGEAFGQDCCIALNQGEIIITSDGMQWRFARGTAGWHTVYAGAP